MSRPPPEEKMKQISVVLPEADVEWLKAAGKAAKPFPASVNALIRVAVKDFRKRYKPAKE